LGIARCCSEGTKSDNWFKKQGEGNGCRLAPAEFTKNERWQ
jgi:KilA-N domain